MLNSVPLSKISKWLSGIHTDSCQQHFYNHIHLKNSKVRLCENSQTGGHQIQQTHTHTHTHTLRETDRKTSRDRQRESVSVLTLDSVHWRKWWLTYVEGNIVSKSIATALVFLNRACGTMLIQKSLAKMSLCCALSKSDVSISKTSIWRAASSIEVNSVLASVVHWPSAGKENGCLRKRGMSRESLGELSNHSLKFSARLDIKSFIAGCSCMLCKVQLSSMPLSLQKVQLWPESFSCLVHFSNSVVFAL